MTDLDTSTVAILAESLLAILFLWLALNAAGHFCCWLWRVASGWWNATPPKPELGPYQGPRIIGPGDFVRAGQAQRGDEP